MTALGPGGAWARGVDDVGRNGHQQVGQFHQSAGVPLEGNGQQTPWHAPQSGARRDEQCRTGGVGAVEEQCPGRLGQQRRPEPPGECFLGVGGGERSGDQGSGQRVGDGLPRDRLGQGPGKVVEPVADLSGLDHPGHRPRRVSHDPETRIRGQSDVGEPQDQGRVRYAHVSQTDSAAVTHWP
jgi:hypothetical protein